MTDLYPSIFRKGSRRLSKALRDRCAVLPDKIMLLGIPRAPPWRPTISLGKPSSSAILSTEDLPSQFIAKDNRKRDSLLKLAVRPILVSLKPQEENILSSLLNTGMELHAFTIIRALPASRRDHGHTFGSPAHSSVRREMYLSTSGSSYLRKHNKDMTRP